MRITIDTQQDSKEHILKAIELIQRLLNEQQVQPAMNMFSDETPKQKDDLEPYGF